jgi:hypothetical protein
MEESKTGYYNGSHGATLGTTRGRGAKTVGWGRRIGLAFNDLLPYSLRPIKAGHTIRGGVWHGLRAELFYYKMRWHSHGKYAMRSKLNKLQSWKRR